MSTKAQLETDLVADFKWFCYRGWQVKFSPQRYRRYAAERQFRGVARRLTPGSVVLDCGANVGDVTASFAARGLTVHAFEPDPRCVAALRSRFADNAGIIVHNQAVAAHAGTAQFFRVGAAADEDIGKTVSSSLLKQDFHDSDATYDVEVIDLLDFVANLDRPPGMTKMDIEGAEVEVLERLLCSPDTRLLGEVFVETHEKYQPELRERTQALRERVEKDNLTHIHLNWF